MSQPEFDVIEAAQEIQRFIDGADESVRPELIESAWEALGEPNELYGGRAVFVRSLGAFVLQYGRPVSLDEELYAGARIDDSWLNARFEKIDYVKQPFDGLSLCLSDVTILHDLESGVMDGETIQSGVYVPVNLVKLVLPAAKVML